MPGKKKKPTKSESESEASEKEESEEEEDEGSEEEEDEDKGSDEEEDEDEEDEDNEESEENSEKSDKSGESDDEDKSSKSSSSSSKSSKSGSSDGSKSDSDESDGSGKKAKKKKKKDKNDKDKAKKGKKGKEEPGVESKKSSSKNELPPEPQKLTIASVFQDLDDLSNHLAKTFTTFNEENKAKEVQKQSSPSASPDRKNDSPLSFPNQRPPIHSATLPGGYGSKTQLKPLVDDTGVQCDPEPAEKRQASPEAIRAVQEYKQRKEHERKRKESPSPSPEEPKAVKNGSQVSQGKHRDNSQPRQERDQEEYERVRREERKREQDNTIDFKRRTISPKRTGPNWTRANQIAEDYYSGLYKKSAKNPVLISGQKTVHDLYKYKPKPAFVEDDSQPIVQYDEGDFRRTRDQPTFDVYDPRLKPQNEYSYKYNPLNSNKKPINDAMDVLARKSRNNQKF